MLSEIVVSGGALDGDPTQLALSINQETDKPAKAKVMRWGVLDSNQ